MNGWKGCGYIIINPATGAGAYMISGGLSGGIALILFGLALIMIGLLIAPTTVAAFACILSGVLFIGAGLCLLTGDDRYFLAVLGIVGIAIAAVGLIEVAFAVLSFKMTTLLTFLGVATSHEITNFCTGKD